MPRIVRLFPLAVAAVLAIGATSSGASVSSSKAPRTVWLCKPGALPDPCTPGLSTTVYSPRGKVLRVEHPKQVGKPSVDCFYVYPTVSDQTTGNANLHIDPVERSIALYQVARYSQYCRVFAPMYRQLTLSAIGIGKPTTPPNAKLPLSDVHNALEDYLAHYNHGRGFVLIGHSQGSFVLRSVIARDVDSKPSVRKRLVSAILLGGNVQVKRHSDVGGDFKHIRACRAVTQLGCVIAFSTFDQPVPPNPKFGASSTSGQAVLCTNPASLGGGSAPTDLIVPSEPFDPKSTLSVGIRVLGLTQPHPHTVWVREPGAYRASCSSANSANVLQVKAVNGAQTPNPSPDKTWGLHLLDANIALGNLIAIVDRQAKAFGARQAKGH